MNALRTIYEKIPDNIEVPKEIRNKKAEVIIIPLEDDNITIYNNIDNLYGCIPDFPERFEQGNYEIREEL